jgi:parallel beta-helix repeat protein
MRVLRAALAAAGLLGFVSGSGAATFTVTNTNDDGVGSLRWAIDSANNALPVERHWIQMMLVGDPKSICPTTPLPDITAQVILDGWTQPGFVAAPLVELDGSCSTESDSNGFILRGGNSIVRGFVINHWIANGIYIVNAGGNVVQGNYVGTTMSGDAAAPNGSGLVGDAIYSGVAIDNSNNNRIGGRDAGSRNVLSGNNGVGLAIANGATNNVVQNNLIGTARNGLNAIPNAFSGVAVDQAPGNIIGGTALTDRNVISGNTQYGVAISGNFAANNSVLGNYIGTDLSGTTAVPNVRTGILIFNAPNNFIGGTARNARNVISGNLRAGINIDGSRFPFDNPKPYSGLGNARFNQVIGNYIGVDATGAKALPNILVGIRLFKSQANLLAGNVISGNTQDGIVMQSEDDRSNPRLVAMSNRVEGNKIGTDASGIKPIPNLRNGVLIIGDRNHLGASTPGSGNIIRFNLARGLVSKGPTYATNTTSGLNSIINNKLGNILFSP